MDFVFRIDVGFVFEQDFDRIQIAGARCQHERRLAFRSALVGIGSSCKQSVDHYRIAVDRSQIKRRSAFAVLSYRSLRRRPFAERLYRLSAALIRVRIAHVPSLASFLNGSLLSASFRRNNKRAGYNILMIQ